MAQKSFKTAFDSLLGEGSTQPKANKNTKEIRATFIVSADYLDKLKAISFWEKKMIKATLDEALSNYIEQYENNNGPVQLPK